jgi:hypothetical protein
MISCMAIALDILFKIFCKKADSCHRVGLRLLTCWGCGFEFHRGHGCLSLVSVVCCQVEVCALG